MPSRNPITGTSRCRDDTPLIDAIFETDRLMVRRWRDSDLPDLMAVYGDADAMRWVGDGHPLNEAQCVEWLDVTRQNYAKRGYGMFAAELKASGDVIGFCGIVHPGGQAEAEVKYAYRRSHWGMGLATEALRGLLQHGLHVHGLTRMMATAAPENLASHAVLMKAGMRQTQLRSDEDGGQMQVFHWRAPQPLESGRNEAVGPDHSGTEGSEGTDRVGVGRRGRDGGGA